MSSPSEFPRDEIAFALLEKWVDDHVPVNLAEVNGAEAVNARIAFRREITHPPAVNWMFGTFIRFDVEECLATVRFDDGYVFRVPSNKCWVLLPMKPLRST